MSDQSAVANSLKELKNNKIKSLPTQVFDVNAVMEYTPNKFAGVLYLKDIFQIIFENLHQLFAVDCVVLTGYDQDLTRIIHSQISYISVHQKVITETISSQVPLSAIAEYVARLQYPVLRSKKEWIEEFQENHCLLNGYSNYNYHCYIPLEVNQQVIGTIELHNCTGKLSSSCLSYCNSLSDLLGNFIVKASPAPQSDNVLSLLKQIDQELLQSKEIIARQLLEIQKYKQQLNEERVCTQEETPLNTSYPEIIGAGFDIQTIFNLLDKVAHTETTVLILGETGTGKELIARAIHNGSKRRNKPVIKVNCAAIPPNLIESELFGHEKGSFTGATERRIGKFELANHGTLFLDEIGELPLNLQVKLLRVLQEKEIERVGGKTVISVDVRIVSATNRNLIEEVEAGRFRQDLFYRLNVFPIALPSLRKRIEDIPLLASHFLAHFNERSGKNFIGFSQKALKEMMQYDWPGNVRELEHLIERQVVLSKGTIIKDINVPLKRQVIVTADHSKSAVKTIFDNERDHIFAVLQLCKGRISGDHGAAKLLGIPATTLNSKIKRLALTKKHVF